MKYQELEQRTTNFGIDIIRFCSLKRITIINKSLISQVIKSATSIGANYREANQASSKKDFVNKVKICQKEINETKHWLEILEAVESEDKVITKKLWNEAHELLLIFGKIISKCRE